MSNPERYLSFLKNAGQSTGAGRGVLHSKAARSTNDRDSSRFFSDPMTPQRQLSRDRGSDRFQELVDLHSADDDTLDAFGKLRGF